MTRLMAHPVRVAIVVVALALAGAGVWLWLRAGESTPVSEQRALADFRAQAGAAESPARPGVPRAGVYTYRVSGSEKGGAGPLVVHRALPAEARYIARPVAGGYEEELDLSAEHIEGARYRVGAGGARQTWVRTKVTFLGFGRDDRRTISPAPLHMPLQPRVGQSWRDAYRAGDLPVTVRSRVVRAEAVRVDGRGVPTVVVDVSSVTGGAHPGTRHETLWWAPSLSLPVRDELRMDIGGAVTFTVRARLDLESAVPRT